MKKIILLILLFISKINFSQVVKSVYISGEIYNISNQVEVEDMSDLGKISLPKLRNIFIPESNGHFEINLQIDQPGFFRIGRNILYLSYSDSIYAKLDYLKPEVAIFNGSNKDANNYLRYTPFPMAGSYIINKGIIGESISSTIQRIVDFGNAREKELSSLTTIPEHFVFMEKGRIRADIINSIMDIYYEFPVHHRLKGDTLNKFQSYFKQNINEFIMPFAKDFIDSRYLQLTVYQKIASKLLFINNDLSDKISFSQIKDWLQAENLFNKIVSSQNNTIIDSIGIKIRQINTDKYRVKLQEVYESTKQFSNGSKAINFHAVNVDGKKVSLDEFKGKVIFIDVWATWCGPCIQSIPKLEELKNIFKSNSNIVFLSISIDENRIKWKQFIDSKTMSNPQWIIDRLDMHDYNIVGIPRTIIIDKSFVIHSFYGPSLGDISDIINLLNKISQ